LKDYPAQYIYKPWTAPEAVQKKSGCIVGKDYPAPIVEHAEARKSCMAKMKDNYARQEQIKKKLWKNAGK